MFPCTNFSFKELFYTDNSSLHQHKLWIFSVLWHRFPLQGHTGRRWQGLEGRPGAQLQCARRRCLCGVPADTCGPDRGNSESSEPRIEVSEIVVLGTVMGAMDMEEIVLKKSGTQGKNKNQEQVPRTLTLKSQVGKFRVEGRPRKRPEHRDKEETAPGHGHQKEAPKTGKITWLSRKTQYYENWKNWCTDW